MCSWHAPLHICGVVYMNLNSRLIISSVILVFTLMNNLKQLKWQTHSEINLNLLTTMLNIC